MKPATAPRPMVSVVLPTYNERANVADLLRRLDRAIEWPWEAVVVDDDSPDGTAEEVERVARERPHVRLIVRRGERGLTSAIQTGIDASRGEVVAWMDCDLSMPPEKVPDLVRPVLLGEADAAVGSRYVVGGESSAGGRDTALVRLQKCLTRKMNRLIARAAGVDFHDWTSGFIAVRSDWIRSVRLTGDYGEYFIRLVAGLIARGARVLEVPYRCVPRARGASKTARGPLAFLRLGLRYVWAAGGTFRLLLKNAPASRF